MRVSNPALQILLLATAFRLGTGLIASESAFSVPFTPPTGGAPSGRGGASRGGVCTGDGAASHQQFIPITPSNSQSGLTLAERPTFLVNVPESTAQRIFFTLKDESGRVHYQATLPTERKPGILQIKLPAGVAPLVVDQQYEWGVAILCDDRLQPNSPFVSSQIRRIAAPAKLITQLSKASPVDKVTLYRTNGIWYDAIATLASFRKQEPGNSSLQSAWSDLLNQAGIGEVATQPLL